MEFDKKRGDLIQWFIGGGDLVVLNLLFLVVFYGVNGLYTEALTSHVREVLLLLNFCYFFSLYFVPVQLHVSIVFLDRIVLRAFRLITVLFFLFAVCLLLLNLGDRLAIFLIVYYLSAIVFFSFWHIVVRLTLKAYRRRGKNFKRVIIVGAGKNGMELYRVMKDDLSYGYHVVGFFDDNLTLKSVLPEYLGMTYEVESYATACHVDEIYCTLPGTNDEKILRILNFAEKNMIRFYIVPEFYRNIKKSLVMEMMESVPILTIRKEPLQAIHNRVLKRMFDIAFSLFVLVTLYPLLYVLIGFLIKTGSPGPILFKQKRTGLYGHVFSCLKFRTMKLNERSDSLQTWEHDSRKTVVGDFLRRTNLDEFPQFINVLKGNMSVVGPRPHMLKHTEEYSVVIDKYMIRHLVKPGITGWAQVLGYRGETRTVEQMEGRVKRDVWYIENWSFLLDLKIIVVTVFNMFKGDKNAY